MKYNFKQFDADFPDDAACLEFIFWNRWPDGGKCECGKTNCFHRVAKRRCYSCAFCGAQLHPTAGTIFHKSETSLKSWFFAIFLMAQSRNGVAAKELQRQLGVTYKTAHRMGHKIRNLMHSGGNILSGVVEADETYVGGKREGKRGRGAAGKTAVVGIAERRGGVVAAVRRATDVRFDARTGGRAAFRSSLKNRPLFVSMLSFYHNHFSVLRVVRGYSPAEMNSAGQFLNSTNEVK